MRSKRSLLRAAGLFLALGLLLGGGGCGLLESEEAGADRLCAGLVAALDEGDAQAVAALFSGRAAAQAPQLAEEIAAVLSFWPGSSGEPERISYRSEAHYDNGAHARESYPVYEVETAGGRLSLALAYWPEDTIDPEREGLFSFDVVTEKARSGRYFLYQTDRPGAHYQDAPGDGSDVMLLYGNPRRFSAVERPVVLNAAFFRDWAGAGERSYQALTGQIGEPNGWLSVDEAAFWLDGEAGEKRYALCQTAGDQITSIRIVNEEEVLEILLQEG